MKFLLFFLVFIIGCQSHNVKPDLAKQNGFNNDYNDDEYINIIKSNSKNIKIYEGLYNTSEFFGTFLNEKVMDAQSWRLWSDYQWTQLELNEKRKEDMEKSGKMTRYFFSFYSPIDQNLIGKNSTWRVYLISKNKKIEGIVKRAGGNYPELERLYYFHNRWSTPYVVEFPIATSEVANEVSQITITGPIGSTEIRFN